MQRHSWALFQPWKVSLGELLAYANPRPVAEEGAKANPGGAAERRRNAGPDTALEAQCMIGTAVDGFAQVKERAVEPGTAAEGDALAGASTAEQMRMLPGAWRPGSSSLIATVQGGNFRPLKK